MDCISTTDARRNPVSNHNNGHIAGLRENTALPLSVHWPRNSTSRGGHDVNWKYDMARIPNGDSGTSIFILSLSLITVTALMTIIKLFRTPYTQRKYCGNLSNATLGIKTSIFYKLQPSSI